MSVPRSLSLSGLLVALACSLAACGSSKDEASTATPAPGSQAQVGSPIKPINPTAHDPAACSFLTVKQVAKYLPSVEKSHGIPTACTFTDASGDTNPSIGFLFLSKALITATIARGNDKNQTVREAWDTQLEGAKKLKDYQPVSGVGDSAYAQVDPGTVTLRWFVKDHAFYLHYNYLPSKKSQKKLVTLDDLKKLAKETPDPSSLPTT